MHGREQTFPIKFVFIFVVLGSFIFMLFITIRERSLADNFKYFYGLSAEKIRKDSTRRSIAEPLVEDVLKNKVDLYFANLKTRDSLIRVSASKTSPEEIEVIITAIGNIEADLHTLRKEFNAAERSATYFGFNVKQHILPPGNP